MKKQILILFTLCLFSSGISAQINMPDSDGGQQTVSVTDPITFYDAGGETGDIPNYRTTGITFTPRADEVIEITFETIDLQGSSLIKIFDGKKSLDSYYDDWEQEYTYTIPSGHRVALSGNKTNEIVRSYSADGKLTVCFQNSNGSGAGWKATVKSIARPPVIPEEPTGDILMSLEPKIYIISTPTNLYDDGGKNGKISLNYQGKVTFRPKTVGKKVKITFNVLDLFNTSTIGKNDILKIYSGSEAIESNLLAELLKDPTPVTLKSTADDGTLTVTLKSTTGIAKNGFEAVVQEFQSQPMTFNEVVLAQFTQGTLSAGDKNQAILSVNVRTNDDLNPLTADKFNFTTNGTFANIEKATLYYTAGDNNFSTTHKIGEVVVSGDAFEITCTTPQALLENDNYFWLAYDIKSTAVNDQTIDAGCSIVTISGKNKTVSNAQPAGNRVIKNEYVSTIGTYEKIIFGNWSFTHTFNPYGSGYKAESGNQIITFKPGDAGKVVQVDFADFDVYYSSSSYGTKAKFEIYSGSGTAGEKLWEADANNKATGPQKIIRSNATDGALTILFNANSSSSYYNGKGWHATVSQYQSVAMQFVDVTATQSNTDIIKPAATNQETIGFEIQTKGDLTPLKLNEVVLNLKGSHDKIKKVSVFQSTNNQFSTKSLIGESVAPSSDNVTITLNPAIALSEGKSYFWVAYDMNDEIASEQIIDAALTSVKIGEDTKTPAVGDPDGERVTKNIFEMQAGLHTVNVSSSLMFYDNGGAEANYAKGKKETVTFIPKAGQVIKLDFKSFKTKYNDYLYVYNGNNESAEEIAKLGGSTLPGTILSTADDGSLTVSFTPTSSYFAGWEVEVSSYIPLPLTVTSITSKALSSEKLLKGATNEKMLKVEVEVTGDKGMLDFTSFDFRAENTANSADIAAANLYFTDTISTFSSAQKYTETLTASPFEFTGNTAITKPGVYKFWLTFDVTPNATLGNVVEAKLANVELANTAQTIAQAEVASRTIQAGFSGTYSVGTPSSDYPTLSAAINAMNGGVDGKVVFNIENGTYNELIKIPHINGTSSKNTITIQSKSENYANVIFEVNRYSAPGYGEEKNGMFTIYGADYLTIKGISMKTTAAFPSVLNVKKISEHVTIDNCFIQAPTSTSYSGVTLVRTEAENIEYANNNYFTIQNSILDGGRVAIYLDGTGFVRLPKQKGGKILTNTIRNQGAMGIYMTKEHDGVVDGNIITNNGETSYTFKAIDAVMMGNTLIRNNKINVSIAKAVNAIYLRKRDDSETLEGRNQIYNNEVIIASSGSATIAGIYLSGAGISHTDIVYNSINVVTSSNKKSAPFYISGYRGMPTDNTIKNNLFQNNAGQKVYYINKKSFVTGNAFSHNALYTSGTIFAYAGNDIASFDDWKTVSSETNSKVEKAQFVSETSLDLSIPGGLLTAAPLGFVVTDINGLARHATLPTIGAYEFVEATLPQFADSYPVIDNVTHNTAKVKVKITENGKLFFLAKKSTETEPTKEEVLATTAIGISKNTEKLLDVSGLESQIGYKLYFVLQSLAGENSNIVVSKLFTTVSQPTEVSTFEGVTVTSGDFSDGTADFSGFVVEAVTDGQGPNNKKAAKMSANSATVTINNNSEGLTLNGFYFKSDVAVELTAKKGVTAAGTKSLQATAGKWVFINLKDLSKITSITLTGAGSVFIDNFSGKPQPITFMLENKTVNKGESLTIESDIYGGALPYTYKWTNAKNETISTDANLSFVPQNTTKVTLTVTDAWSSTSSFSSVVTVIGKSAVASFEDLHLEPESRWWGDSTSSTYYSTFYSGSYAFSNMLMEEYSTWGGFAYSNKTSVAYTPSNFVNDQFNSAAGHGVNNSKNYAIGYVGTAPINITVTHDAKGDSISGLYITNTAWVKYCSEKGTGMNSTGQSDANTPFGTGDWYKITAKGDNDKTVDFYLADYRSENTANHYTLDTWQWMDLRALGKVKTVTFQVDGTRKNAYGSTIPSYFCVDDFGGKRNVSVVTEKKIHLAEVEAINLASLFTTLRNANVKSDIVYQIVDVPNASIAVAKLSDGNLTISGVREGSTNLVVSRTLKGKTVFVKIPLKISNLTTVYTSKDNINLSVFPNPATTHFSVNVSGSLAIYTANGIKMYQDDNYDANLKVDISSFDKGVYVVRLNGVSKKLIKR